MRKVLNKNNLIFILIIMTLFNLMMPTISYAANISINDMLKETVAAWYMILRAIAIGCMILLFLVLAMKAAVTRNAGDSALLKTMIKDWAIALLLVIFIHYFMIASINLNEMAVAGSESLGQSLSGMEEDQEISLYESAITKAYEVKFTPGTIGMILYMMLVYYAYKFTFIYLKRYINVLALILLAPIVCVFYAFRKVLSGKKVALGKWFKEFIYNVFLQSLHAILYASVIGLTLKLSDDGENFIGAILTLIVFGFIFKVDKLVRKVFNTVGGDTSVAVSRVESIKKNALSTAKSVGTSQAGSGMAAAFGESTQIGSKLKNKFGDGLSPSLITDGIKSDASIAFMDMKNNFKSNVDEVKGIVEDIPDTMAGKNKQVTKEQIAKEEEKMRNAGVLGKAWFAVLGAPEYVSKKIEEIKNKTEEVKLYLENKKTDAINYINDLQKDIETIRTIPSLIREVRQLPSLVRRPKIGMKGNKVDPRYQALFDTDVDTTELKNRYQKMLELSAGGVVTTAALAQGYEVFLRAPKMGLMVLAEQNYKNMVHVEVPMENRRVLAGYKRKATAKYNFSNFENGSIETIEQCIVIDACKIFAGLRSLQRVVAGVQKGTITYRSVPEGADTTVIHYRGKGNSSRKLHMNTQLLVERLKSFRSDTQVAVNINLLNQLELMQNKDTLTNLSPEMLGMLEQAGVVRKFENNGKVGYIVLDKAIENVVKTKKINDFIDSNPENPLAQKINQFLTENSDSEMAIKISNYVIENPDSVLAKVVDKIGIAEDGSLFLKVDSFNVGEQVPDFSQLGVVKENQIEQMIVTEDGQLLKQVIDLQGNIIVPATDQEGNVVELPSVNGVVVQRILTPEGKIVQQVLSQDGTTVKPIVYVNTLEQKPIVTSINNVEGVVTQVMPDAGRIQIIDKVTGEVKEIKPEEGTIQIVKAEDGSIQLVNTETQEVVSLGETSIIQVIKPQDSMIQVINVENQTLEIASGENALRMLIEQGIGVTQKEKQEFITGIKETPKTEIRKLDNVEGIVTQVAPLEGEIQILNKETGKVESIKPEDVTIQIVKSEDGSIKLINTETQEVINLGEEYVVQVVKSKDATVQIIDLKNQTIETATGENALMMAVEQSIEIAPALKDEFVAGIKESSKPKVEKIDDVKGIVTQIAPLEGEIQILNKETGKVESIRPEDVTIQIVKSEDGSIQLVNTETQEVINLGEEYVVQVVKPKEAEVQVIDMSKQTIKTASGKTALKMVVEQGIEIAPSIKEEFVTVVKEGVKPKAGIEKFENVTGIVTEIAPFVGEIQIVNKQTGKTKSVNAQSGTFQVVKNKDGSVQLVNTETLDTILLEEDAIVQVINPQEATMKTINVENQTIETTLGDVATRVIQEQQLREKVKEDLAEMIQPVALDLSTGTTEPVVDLSLETQILSTVVENIVTEPNYELTEENRLNKLNGLLGQIAELQGEQTAEELIEALKAESEKVLVEVGTETKQLKQLTEMSMPIDPTMFTTTATSAENELNQLVEILQQGRTDVGADSTSTETYSYTDTYEEDNTPSSMMDTIKAYLSQNDTVDTTSYTDDIGTTSYYDTEFTDYVDTTVTDTVDTNISDTQRFYNDILRKVTGKSTSTTTASIEDSVEYSQNVLDNVVEAVGTPVEESPNSSKSATMNLLNEVLKKTTGKTITPQVEDSVKDAVFETIATEEPERRTNKRNKFLRREPTTDRTSKNQKTEEPKSEGIYFSVTGAVVSEGRVWIQIGKKVREAIELVGGFTENADRKAIESLLNTIIDKNNASIHVPEIEMIEVEVTGEVRNPGTYFMKCNYSTVREAIEAAGGWTEKANKKVLKEQLNDFITKTTITIDVPKLRKGETNDDDTDVETIRCYISGEVASPGEKELNKGSTVSDLIVKAGHLTGRENQQAIQLNCGRFVDINYVLSNNDSIFIPRLEYEESDKRRGYSTSDIKDAIREEFKQYKLRNPKKEKETEAQYLQALRKNKNIMYMISKKISARLKDKKIILTIDEIENRLDDFLKKEIEKQRGAKSQDFSDLLDNVTMFSGDQIQGASDIVAKRLSTEKVIISRGKTKKERAASMLFEEIQNILNNDDISNKKYTETT